jgi:hypothetical protein
MPLVEGFPTWKNMNSQNSTSSSGQTDPVTGYSYPGDGLYPGIYADMTNDEAANASNPLVGSGLLYNGRYRWVKVDSGATAANITTGTIGYIRSGSTVKTAVTTNVGSGLTTGVYQIPANVGSGGGSGAILQISVSGGVIVGNPIVIAGGFGYVSAPSFNVTALTGGSSAAVAAQLNVSENTVTSADQAIGTAPITGFGAVHPVVFLNAITPGNYGFIQESGVATVAAGSGNTQAQNNNAIVASGASANGQMAASAATYSFYTIGTVIDPVTAPPAGTLFKIQMTTAPIQD